MRRALHRFSASFRFPPPPPRELSAAGRRLGAKVSLLPRCGSQCAAPTSGTSGRALTVVALVAAVALPTRGRMRDPVCPVALRSVVLRQSLGRIARPLLLQLPLLAPASYPTRLRFVRLSHD